MASGCILSSSMSDRNCGSNNSSNSSGAENSRNNSNLKNDHHSITVQQHKTTKNTSNYQQQQSQITSYSHKMNPKLSSAIATYNNLFCLKEQGWDKIFSGTAASNSILEDLFQNNISSASSANSTNVTIKSESLQNLATSSTSGNSSSFHCSKRGNNSVHQDDEYRRRKGTVMRLDKVDMGLYGLFPETDPFFVVICDICNAVVKPQGLKKHLASRHHRQIISGTSSSGSISNTSHSTDHHHSNLNQHISTAANSSGDTTSHLLHSSHHYHSSNRHDRNETRDNSSSSRSSKANRSNSKNRSSKTSISGNNSSVSSNSNANKERDKSTSSASQLPSVLLQSPKDKLTSETLQGKHFKSEVKKSDTSATGNSTNSKKHAETAIIGIVASSNSNSSISSGCSSLSSYVVTNNKSAIAATKPTSNTTLPVNSTSSNKRTHGKSKVDHRKVLPIKDRDYDPDKHCGVMTGEPSKPCTRSLTCKSHALSLRRAVGGRCKPFDKLLADHRASKESLNKNSANSKNLQSAASTLASTSSSRSLPETELSNSSSSIDLDRRSLHSVGSNSNLSVVDNVNNIGHQQLAQYQTAGSIIPSIELTYSQDNKSKASSLTTKPNLDVAVSKSKILNHTSVVSLPLDENSKYLNSKKQNEDLRDNIRKIDSIPIQLLDDSKYQSNIFSQESQCLRGPIRYLDQVEDDDMRQHIKRQRLSDDLIDSKKSQLNEECKLQMNVQRKASHKNQLLFRDKSTNNNNNCNNNNINSIITVPPAAAIIANVFQQNNPQTTLTDAEYLLDPITNSLSIQVSGIFSQQHQTTADQFNFGQLNQNLLNQSLQQVLSPFQRNFELDSVPQNNHQAVNLLDNVKLEIKQEFEDTNPINKNEVKYEEPQQQNYQYSDIIVTEDDEVLNVFQPHEENLTGELTIIPTDSIIHQSSEFQQTAVDKRLNLSAEFDYDGELQGYYDESELGLVDMSLSPNSRHREVSVSHENQSQLNEKENLERYGSSSCAADNLDDDCYLGVKTWYPSIPKPIHMNQFGLIKMQQRSGCTLFNKTSLTIRKTSQSFNQFNVFRSNSISTASALSPILSLQPQQQQRNNSQQQINGTVERNSSPTTQISRQNSIGSKNRLPQQQTQQQQNQPQRRTTQQQQQTGSGSILNQSRSTNSSFTLSKSYGNGNTTLNLFNRAIKLQKRRIILKDKKRKKISTWVRNLPQFFLV